MPEKTYSVEVVAAVADYLKANLQDITVGTDVPSKGFGFSFYSKPKLVWGGATWVYVTVYLSVDPIPDKDLIKVKLVNSAELEPKSASDQEALASVNAFFKEFYRIAKERGFDVVDNFRTANGGLRAYNQEVFQTKTVLDKQRDVETAIEEEANEIGEILVDLFTDSRAKVERAEKYLVESIERLNSSKSVKTKIKSTQVAINQALIECGIPEADEVLSVIGNKYELVYVGSPDDIDSDQIVNDLEDAGFNPQDDEWLSTSDFEDLPVTEDYLEGFDDGLDQPEEFRVTIEYNP